MKNLITIIALVSLLFTSCTKEPSTEEKVKMTIEAELMKTLNDPKSYEFVEMNKLDTTYVKNYYSKLIKDTEKLESETLISNSVRNKKSLELISEYKKYGAKKYASDIAKLENSIKENADFLKKIEDTKAKYQNKFDNAKDTDILDISTVFTCRANNKMGAKILANYIVRLTDSLTLKEIKQAD
jgi:PBP1b-binding outer membrane lipoprotein LpoB